MNYLLLSIFIFQCAYLVYWGLKKPQRMYEYPFLFGLVLVGIFALQIIGLINSGSIELSIITPLLLMINLCTLAVYLGYVKGRKEFKLLRWEFDYKRLLISSFILSVVGGYFYFLYSRLPAQYITGLVSGIAVIYNFFGMALFYGFTIALLLYLKNKSKIALVLVCLDSLVYFDRIFIIGRRAEAFEFVFAILLSLWFVKKIIIPRKLLLTGFIIGLLFLYSTADYRKITLESNEIYWEDLFDLPLVEKLEYILNNGGAETETAAYEIAGTEIKRDFDFGTFQWNRLIHTYIPSYLFGYQFKEALMIKLGTDAAFKEYRFVKAASTARTGFTDAFQSFWYFGFIIFFIIAFILSKIYKTAMSGNIAYQVFYIAILSDALLIITHSTTYFFMPWLHIFLFLFPLLLFSKKPRRIKKSHLSQVPAFE